MKKTTVYGIKNCDSMKKAFAWLDKRKVAYDFHDYKKSGAEAAVLERAIRELGWEQVINRKGTTWRGLPDKVKAGASAANAVALAVENPSVIKRPLIVHAKGVLAGYDEDALGKVFPKP